MLPREIEGAAETQGAVAVFAAGVGGRVTIIGFRAEGGTRRQGAVASVTAVPVDEAVAGG
jgi:hypothetical protein